MKLLSIDNIPGQEIEALGMVKGAVVQTKHFGKDFMAGLKTLVGGELKEYNEMMNDARALATKRMVAEAEATKPRPWTPTPSWASATGPPRSCRGPPRCWPTARR